MPRDNHRLAPSERRRGGALQSALATKDARLHGTAGHFQLVRPSLLEEWRALGEAGQLLLGMKMGFTPQEVACKREWTDADLGRYTAEAVTWLVAQHGNPTTKA